MRARVVLRRALHPCGWTGSISASAGVALLVVGLGLCWMVSVALDGTEHIAPHWFYLPIFFAGLRFGRRGAVLTSAAAVVVAGPLLPADADTWAPQPASDWVSRGLFFVGIGLIVAELFGALRRTSDTRAAEVELRARLDADTCFRVLVENSHDVITVLDDDGTLLARHGPVAAVFGDTAAAATGTLHSLLHPDDRGTFEAAFARVRASGRTETLTLRMADGDGWRHLETHVRDLRGEPSVGGIALTSRDITEREALHAELEHRATHDPPAVVALLCLDLDGFKSINDSYGHATGDQLLVELAHRLQLAVRGSDTAARLGGDEFAVLLPDLPDATAATAVVDTLTAVLTRPVRIADLSLSVGVSIGVATTTEAGFNAATLHHHADAAMYRSKRSRPMPTAATTSSTSA